MSPAAKPGSRASAVRPGAILRAMGAAPESIAPTALELPDIERADGRPSHSASIELVRDGERVLKILAHCRCGEVITIDCDYSNAPSAKTD
jgi:hypothetical protein